MKKVVQCPVCGYTSKSAYWVGDGTTESGSKVFVNGYVKFNSQENAYPIDKLIHKIETRENEEVVDWDGSAHCLNCKAIL
jgi:hypothetical protein